MSGFFSKLEVQKAKIAVLGDSANGCKNEPTAKHPKYDHVFGGTGQSSELGTQVISSSGEHHCNFEWTLSDQPLNEDCLYGVVEIREVSNSDLQILFVLGKKCFSTFQLLQPFYHKRILFVAVILR